MTVCRQDGSAARCVAPVPNRYVLLDLHGHPPCLRCLLRSGVNCSLELTKFNLNLRTDAESSSAGKQRLVLRTPMASPLLSGPALVYIFTLPSPRQMCLSPTPVQAFTRWRCVRTVSGCRSWTACLALTPRDPARRTPSARHQQPGS